MNMCLDLLALRGLIEEMDAGAGRGVEIADERLQCSEPR